MAQCCPVPCGDPRCGVGDVTRNVASLFSRYFAKKPSLPGPISGVLGLKKLAAVLCSHERASARS